MATKIALVLLSNAEKIELLQRAAVRAGEDNFINLEARWSVLIIDART